MQEFLSVLTSLAWPFAITLAWLVGEFGQRWTGLPRISFYGLVGFILAAPQLGILPLPEGGTTLLLADVGFGLILFELGQTVIGYYLANFITANIYGAAGGIIVLLVWVYYSAQIFLLGAEFTKVWAEHYGSQRRKAMDYETSPSLEEA